MGSSGKRIEGLTFKSSKDQALFRRVELNDVEKVSFLKVLAQVPTHSVRTFN
jgi:hypothetical protein